MKKIISLLMVLCIMASLCTVSAFAEEVTVNDSAEFIAAAGNSSCDTIVLGDDITLDADLIFSNGVDLKFNGYTIDANGKAIKLNANLTIVDEGSVANPGGFYGEENLFLAPGLYPYEDEENGVLYVCARPDKPNASVELLPNAESYGLSSAYSFSVGKNTEFQKEFYARWYVDFVIEFNKDVVLNADESADGYLSGQYDDYGAYWLNVPFDDVSIAANAPFRIMEYAAGYLNQPGLKIIFSEVLALETFNCGIFLNDEFISKNPDLEVKLSLCMYNPMNEAEYLLIDSKTVKFFDLQDVVDNGNGSSEENPITLPAEYAVTEPVVIRDNTYLALGNGTLASSLSRADGYTGSLFTLENGAIVKILGDNYTDAELNLIRSMLPKDYCVYKGSIVIRDSHEMENGVCKHCGVQVVSNPYAVPATADNSNMPLWTILFIGFAAVALLTGKKKKA